MPKGSRGHRGPPERIRPLINHLGLEKIIEICQTNKTVLRSCGTVSLVRSWRPDNRQQCRQQCRQQRSLQEHRFSSGNTDSALETPIQLWIPDSAPGEPELEIPNMRLSLYFHFGYI